MYWILIKNGFLKENQLSYGCIVIFKYLQEFSKVRIVRMWNWVQKEQAYSSTSAKAFCILSVDSGIFSVGTGRNSVINQSSIRKDYLPNIGND